MFAQILDLRSQTSQRPMARGLANSSSFGVRASGFGSASDAALSSKPPTPTLAQQQASVMRLSRSANNSVDDPDRTERTPDGGTGGTRAAFKPREREFLSRSPPPNRRQDPRSATTPSPKGSPQHIQQDRHRPPLSAGSSPSSSGRYAGGSPGIAGRGPASASAPSIAPAAEGLDVLFAVLNIQLACWSHIEIASQDMLNFSGMEDNRVVHIRSAELHFKELLGDMTKQSSRLRQALDSALASRAQARKGRVSAAQIDPEACLRAECERLVAEKAEVCRRLADVQAEGERKHLERAVKDETTRAEMSRQSHEFQAERERMELEKDNMLKQMSNFQEESMRKMRLEEAEMAMKIEKLRAESERKIALERAAASRRLAESRQQTERQVQKERQVTQDIMVALQELPPLQTAMELGDLRLLETELEKWKFDALPDRFGECKGVVQAVVKLAQERVITWRGVEYMLRDVMKEVEHLQTNNAALTRQCQRVFRVLKESQLTKIDLRRSDPQALDRICEVLLTWQERTMLHPNEVQRLIVQKVVTWPHLGAFDFADMDICLRLVDRENCEAFLSRAKQLVENESTAPQDLKPRLSHIETMLFFLKYATLEDLQLTHAEFRKQAAELEPEVAEYFKWAEQEYPPGCELVRVSPGKDLMDGKNVASVLQELRKPRDARMKDGLGPFRDFFYQWALAMHNTFNLLVLPHHTQAVCLLAFRRFLESNGQAHTLIAQVGTGEGKSMIIASLAAYVVVHLRKKVHIVVDDETLLERDFESFKGAFESFELPTNNTPRKMWTSREKTSRKMHAVLCLSEERLATKPPGPCYATRIDPTADICYCEAKHVQSFYASIARGDKPNFDSYNERVLILDEVDALVIDEEPNDVFVYENKDLSRMATAVAGNLVKGASPDAVASSSKHPAAGRLVAEMSKEWARAKQMKAGEDFVFLKESGKYCALQSGRANPKSWSLALECRNFQDGLAREILFKERLFAASRPRVFRKYHRIMGLSGSVGSRPEQNFLRDTYGARFFKVPPFLKTCRGSPFHEALPVKLGQARREVYLEASAEAQVGRLVEIAFEARERVPVLVIAKDRGHADLIVDRLRQVARSRGVGALSEDMVRSLSRTLYEANAEQWKENLNRSTLALGDGDARGKSWRITVTDPRGARGTDYRVDDLGVNSQGGLLLIPLTVPGSRRDWIQYLGRTARQDNRGQFCCVLNGEDFRAQSQKNKEALPVDGTQTVIDKVLGWGDKDSQDRIQKSAALYNCGLRMNELCEEVFGKRGNILEDANVRESLVEVCQRFRWMSVREIDQAFQKLPNFDPTAVPTEAKDMGRPAELEGMPSATNGTRVIRQGTAGAMQGFQPPKIVMFCLDWSASMSSKDTGTSLSRFDTCLQCIQRIMRDQVRDHDLVGCVVFGPDVRIVFQPTPKGQGGKMLEMRIAGLRPQMVGGTKFFDAVAQSLQLMSQTMPADAARWLVCLTDGDDLGSQPQNGRGEIVTRMLHDGSQSKLNMVVVTVGSLKAINVQIIQAWVERVSKVGGLGRHIPEKNAAAIAQAFDVVAECLAVEVGGAVEC